MIKKTIKYVLKEYSDLYEKPSDQPFDQSDINGKSERTYNMISLAIILDIPFTIFKVRIAKEKVRRALFILLDKHNHRSHGRTFYQSFTGHSHIQFDFVVVCKHRKQKRVRFLFINLTLLISGMMTVALLNSYPYTKLYHDLRGGMLKLMAFVKIGRFCLTFVELQFNDYNLDRLFEIMYRKELFRLDPFVLIGLYNSIIV